MWLAQDGCWWVGTAESKDSRSTRGYLHSRIVEAGELPQSVEGWSESVSGMWQTNRKICACLPSDAADKWREAYQRALQVPVIKIEGVESSTNCQGLYDLMEEESASGEPPVFRNQIDWNTWLYLGEDRRWWIGNETCKNARKAEGRLHSEPIFPGDLPTSCQEWTGFDKDEQWVHQSHVVIS